MVQQHKQQSGVASSSPSNVMRWLTSRLLTKVGSEARLEKQRVRAEKQRRKSGSAHVVEYYHYVEDGYSHLAAQMLSALQQRYDIELVCHLVRGPSGDNSVEPALLLQLSRLDSSAIAPHYNAMFPPGDAIPDSELVDRAEKILANLDSAAFTEAVVSVGEALWSGDSGALQKLAERYGEADADVRDARLEAGHQRRSALGHYSGAMFHYGGEWYWGVDRLYHLELRLQSLGADRQADAPLLAPRPQIEDGPLRDNGQLTLEIYPSLRSPYTAIIFDRAVSLAEKTGVKLEVRPVLPMVMRGVPATRQKGFYIFSDTGREARALGVPFGPFYDPIGEPVRRAYSLYPWACEQGLGNALISSFLRAAFTKGMSTNNDRGLRHVVEDAGLDWSVAQGLIGKPGWEEQLEDNRLAMYQFGSWGVPSFRLIDERGEQVLALWGQDRLWLFSREIQRLLQRRSEQLEEKR